MARVVIDAAPIEVGLFSEQWQAFTEELEAAGHSVEIQSRPEWRSRLPPVELPEAETVRVFVWVAKEAAGETLAAVVLMVGAALRRHLKGRLKGRPPRKVEIVNPRGGEPLAVVEVSDDD